MDQWYETCRGVVFPWHCDHYGHMNTSWYAHFFDDADYHLWTMTGLAQSIDRVVGQTKTDYLHELKDGELLVVKNAWIHVGNKSLRHRGHLSNADTGILCARQETTLVCFDPEKRVSAPMPDVVRKTLSPLVVDPDSAPAPDHVNAASGRPIALDRVGSGRD